MVTILLRLIISDVLVYRGTNWNEHTSMIWSSALQVGKENPPGQRPWKLLIKSTIIIQFCIGEVDSWPEIFLYTFVKIKRLARVTQLIKAQLEKFYHSHCSQKSEYFADPLQLFPSDFDTHLVKLNSSEQNPEGFELITPRMK